MKLSQDELITHCLDGDSKALNELYNRYSPKLWGICLRYAKNEMSAEDIMQEGFIRIYRYLSHYKGKGSFEGWMRRTMVNTAINYYKKNLRTGQESQFDEAFGISSTSADAISQLSTQELLNLVSNMPDGYRTVFNMYVVDGFSHKEIAKELGISENTSKSQLSRARSFLKEKVINLYRS